MSRLLVTALLRPTSLWQLLNFPVKPSLWPKFVALLLQEKLPWTSVIAEFPVSAACHIYINRLPVRGCMNEQSGERIQTEFIFQFTNVVNARVYVCMFERSKKWMNCHYNLSSARLATFIWCNFTGSVPTLVNLTYTLTWPPRVSAITCVSHVILLPHYTCLLICFPCGLACRY